MCHQRQQVRLGSIILLAVILIGLKLTPVRVASVQQPYWPTTEWKSIAPEQQGMDSESLVKVLEFVKDHTINLQSLLIIRHGYVVTEAYFYPYTSEIRHDLVSATKSVISALVVVN